MPEDLAPVIVQVLKIVNAILGIWVDPAASEPLTSHGLVLVNAVGDVSTIWANFIALLLMENPI